MSTPQNQGEWVVIGEVGVDSGQLLITDPRYINSQWKTEEKGGKRRLAPVYMHTDGTALFCALHGGSPPFAAIAFGNYESVIPKYGKTPNAMIAEGLMVKQPDPKPCGEYSYQGCCDATLADAQAGQLNYELGHSGAGVAFSSGLGDGCYQVSARYVELDGWGRRIAEVRILLIDEDEEDDDGDWDDMDEESTSTETISSIAK